jgi:hypothetical protein
MKEEIDETEWTTFMLECGCAISGQHPPTVQLIRLCHEHGTFGAIEQMAKNAPNSFKKVVNSQT